jgi:hypothetical protein
MWRIGSELPPLWEKHRTQMAFSSFSRSWSSSPALEHTAVHLILNCFLTSGSVD